MHCVSTANGSGGYFGDAQVSDFSCSLDAGGRTAGLLVDATKLQINRTAYFTNSASAAMDFFVKMVRSIHDVVGSKTYTYLDRRLQVSSV